MRGVTRMRYALLILTAIAAGVYASYATYRMLDSNMGSLASGVDSTANRSAAQGTPISDEKP
jgi:hypothetical protein